MKSPRAASLVVVETLAGKPTTLCLLDGAGLCATIPLGPAECVALASDLLLAARVSYGRPVPETSDTGGPSPEWPANRAADSLGSPEAPDGHPCPERLSARPESRDGLSKGGKQHDR
jgi:hypothetical protein